MTCLASVDDAAELMQYCVTCLKILNAIAISCYTDVTVERPVATLSLQITLEALYSPIKAFLK